MTFSTQINKTSIDQINANGDENSLSELKTFDTMGKELQVLKKGEETELFNYDGKGCITRMWFGGSFKGVEYTDIRFYVDGEEKASIDLELFLGHGIGFGYNHAPWGTERMGNIGEKVFHDPPKTKYTTCVWVYEW